MKLAREVRGLEHAPALSARVARRLPERWRPSGSYLQKKGAKIHPRPRRALSGSYLSRSSLLSNALDPCRTPRGSCPPSSAARGRACAAAVTRRACASPASVPAAVSASRVAGVATNAPAPPAGRGCRRAARVAATRQTRRPRRAELLREERAAGRARRRARRVGGRARARERRQRERVRRRARVRRALRRHAVRREPGGARARRPELRVPEDGAPGLKSRRGRSRESPSLCPRRRRRAAARPPADAPGGRVGRDVATSRVPSSFATLSVRPGRALMLGGQDAARPHAPRPRARPLRVGFDSPLSGRLSSTQTFRKIGILRCLPTGSRSRSRACRSSCGGRAAPRRSACCATCRA